VKFWQRRRWAKRAGIATHGPAGGAVEHGEYCKVIELLPHAYTEPNGTAYIGDWARVESMDEPGMVFAKSQCVFHPPQTRLEKRFRQLTP
jgi:hypothetical protein